ncbi:restriction endonuclease subunit S [Aeromonas jandaei]|uniref:restriction endonuclease subunit S n=1 Tax=Aeromonas jandaei TaxID=650 RepID=UPI003EC52880
MTLTAMPKYEAYKDSGVEWIGEIPKDWELTKLGTCLTPVSIKNRADLPLLSITRELGVIERDVEDLDSNHNFIPDDLSGYKVIESGQFGMNKMKAWQGSYGVSKHTGIVSPAYYIFKFKKDINPDFFHWAIRSHLYISFFASASDGVRIGQWDLSKDRMKEIPFVFPQSSIQIAIAKFLNEKTTQIDEAIAIKEQQIALLNERKQILIQQAVTQGLDPNVPMKDSGVAWIGKIPKHWEYRKIKYFIEVLPGFAFKSQDYSNNPEDLKLLRGINVSPDQIKWDDTVFWPKEKTAGLDSFMLKKGDLVIAMDRPWVSSGIRIAEIQKDDLPCLLLQRVGRIRGGSELSTEYVKLLLSTNLFLSYFEPMLTGISVPHISTDQIEQFCCPIPSIKEQNDILQFIRNEMTQFEKTLSIQKYEIDKLKEYKTTLINSAVTGKIKVV